MGVTGSSRSLFLGSVAAVMVHTVSAQVPLAPAPGQPNRNNAPLNQFEIVGNSIASGQQVRARLSAEAEFVCRNID